MRLVGILLVRNEDVFLERVIRNVAGACDRLYAFDHVSTDRTPRILRVLEREFDHLTVRRTRDASASHRAIEAYAGTPTWVLGVDGDELYDPAGLDRLKHFLVAGGYDDSFHVKGHVLNCIGLDDAQRCASGYISPPSRPVTKLFNFAAVHSWTGCLERLHAGNPDFRDGYGWESLRYASEETDWESDPLRMLHVCFLRRSSVDSDDRIRLGLPETGSWKRGPTGAVDRLRRRRSLDPRMKEYASHGSSWKQEWYARGPIVTMDAGPFLGASVRSPTVRRPAQR